MIAAMAPRHGDELPHTANGLATPSGTPSLDQRARHSGPIDLESGRFALSPKMAWSLLAAAGVVGASIAGVYYRVGGIEGTIVEMREEISADRVNHYTKQQAYIDCLEHERANKGTICPLAKAPPPVAAPSPRKARRTAKTEQPSLFSWPFQFGTTAQAKQK